MDGRTGAQAARGEAPAQGGDQDFLLGSCLISPPGRPLPRVPDREWGAPPGVGCPGSSPLSARRPVRPWETQLGSGRAGAHLGSGARALPSSSRGTAGTPRAKPAPPERRAGIPSAHSALRAPKKPRLRRRARTLGWWGRGLNPAGFPPGNSEQGSSARVLERLRYHLAPFRCTSGCACLPSSRTSGDQGGSVPSRGILSSLRIRTVAAPRGRRCNPRHQ